MKVNQLTEQVLFEDDYCLLSYILREGKYGVSFTVKGNKGGKVVGKGLATVPNDSLAVGTLAGIASHEIRKRFSRRKHTVHFYAKDVDERRLYDNIVKDLLKTGLYKQVRRVNSGGGILWELSRKKI